MDKVIKTIELCKHPYMWKLNVEFGTLDDMLKNRYHLSDWDGIEVLIGGSFNKDIDDYGGRRAPLVQIGVQLDGTFKVKDGVVKVDGVTTARGIRKNSWEGTYCYISLFDDMLADGLFPVRCDWNGQTYIESGSFDKDGNWKTGYKLANRLVY